MSHSQPQVRFLSLTTSLSSIAFFPRLTLLSGDLLTGSNICYTHHPTHIHANIHFFIIHTEYRDCMLKPFIQSVLLGLAVLLYKFLRPEWATALATTVKIPVFTAILVLSALDLFPLPHTNLLP